jgi:hypothetical protein
MATYARATSRNVKQALDALARAAGDVEKAAGRALTQVGMFYARELKRGIVSQAPGGQPFKPLADITIAYKHSTKALIDEGDFKAAITHRRVNPKAVFSGILRTAPHPRYKGTIANLGAIHEEGSKTVPGHPPARPWLRPIARSVRLAADANRLYRRAVAKRLRATLGRRFNVTTRDV